MAALVQTIPQQSGTVPVLQSRPSSSSGSFPPSPQSVHHPQSARSMSWNSFNPPGGSASYRGHPVVTPPYAVSHPPHLSSPANRQSWSPQLRPEHRTSSAPSVPQGSPGAHHSRLANHPAAGSVSSSSNSSVHSYHSKDDSAIPSRSRTPPLRPLSTANLASPSSHMVSPVSKPSPDRYRRGNRRADAVSPGHPAPSRAHASSLANDPSSSSVSSNSPTPRGLPPDVRPRGHSRVSSADETGPEKSHPELAKRYRRRSWGTMDNANLINMQLHLPVPSPISSSVGSQDYFDQAPRPRSAHSQRDVSGSSQSAHSSTSSVRETSANDSMSSSSAGPTRPDDPKRTSRPSPLSKPIAMDSPSSPSSPQPAPTKESTPSPAPAESPASKRLTEIKNEPKKPGKSRLRRAFSFGSASELVKASSQNNANKKEAIEVEKARRDLLKEQLGPEQAAIAEQQEASGLGESIYSHHGHLFGSTDDLSVSSTASSASVMLRKMGKGMKRSTRSLVGLFRPKSLASVKSTDGALIEPTAPQVSVVNIEAERESVTVNPDPQDHPRGATVFPKVERDSQEARRSTHEGNAPDDPQSRKSIVGGDRERAEVLAAVRKGILKKAQSDSVVPSARVDGHNGSDSPHSSVPSTPEDQTRSGNKRHDGVKIAGEDDFISDGRLPGTDATAAQAELPKSLVFSPRIQFHETWPSGEYDRRGDIATCNRLTPLLAQQIKEELNNFKMEMEVHETSKVYTHFL
ncbi:hypothetical protein PHISP_00154 [Aspergillus sp. HF37]|nr:hypothetical protein PHISP_00154 [Aspergillus sp. HF37]